MTGVLLIDKPKGFTSFDVIAKMRGISHERRIGHSGTLDPMATGVLPLFLGKATRACALLPDQDKRYWAEFQLGCRTDTQDCTGRVLRESPVASDAGEVEQILTGFCGEIAQIPPMFSAVRVGGRRLYDLAREGKTVARRARTVTIFALRLVSADETKHRYCIDVHCSKGTYIRTLCHDIGEKLGCGAMLTALRRTQAAGFGLEDCITLEQAQALAENGRLAEKLLPVERLFQTLPRLSLDARRAELFCNGVRLELARNRIPLFEGQYAVYGESGFLGVAHNDYESGQLRLDGLFVER